MVDQTRSILSRPITILSNHGVLVIDKTSSSLTHTTDDKMMIGWGDKLSRDHQLNGAESEYAWFLYINHLARKLSMLSHTCT